MSPTILNDGTYSYRFYSRNRSHHPHDPHIHVVKANGANARFSLRPVRLVYTRGIGDHGLSAISKQVAVHEERFLREWHKFFNR